MRVNVSPDQIRNAFEAVKDDSSFDESRILWELGRPAAGDPARIRRVRWLRLPGRTARAAGQGARDHHRLADE